MDLRNRLGNVLNHMRVGSHAGLSTESLINLIMQYVADDISPETGTEERIICYQ